jgi:hypothetical protein
LRLFIYTEIYPSNDNEFVASYLYNRTLFLKKSGIDVIIIKTQRGSNIKSIKNIFKNLIFNLADDFKGQKIIKLYSPLGYFGLNNSLPSNNCLTGLILGIQNLILILKYKPSILVFHFLWYTEIFYWLKYFKLSRKISIVHLHGSDVNYIENIKFNDNYLDYTIGSADAIFFSSNSLFEKLKSFSGVNFLTIPHYITYNGWTNNAENKLHEIEGFNDIRLLKRKGYRIITYAGNVYDDKGIKEFLSVATVSKLRKPHDFFLCIGGGPNLDYLKEKANKKALNIKFLGPLKPGIVYEFLRLTDVLINPSKSEGFSTINIEAQSLGKVVLCFDVGGNKEGLVYQEFLITWDRSFRIRVEMILKKLDFIIDFEYSEDIIRKGVEKYSWEKIVNNEIAIYQSLI